MDNFPSPEFMMQVAQKTQEQATQTELYTQIVSASILASREKSLVPLYQLKDRLDFKQALIEISLEDRTRFLEIVGENPTKKQQVTAIQFFLEEERFEGYKEGAEPSGPPSMVIIGYQRFIDNAVEATFFSLRRAEIPKLLHGFKHYYQSDRELGIKLGNPQAGIFCKSLAECLDNDSDLASFILAVAPSFPEDLPEVAEDDAGNNVGSNKPLSDNSTSSIFTLTALDDDILGVIKDSDKETVKSIRKLLSKNEIRETTEGSIRKRLDVLESQGITKKWPKNKKENWWTIVNNCNI